MSATPRPTSSSCARLTGALVCWAATLGCSASASISVGSDSRTRAPSARPAPVETPALDPGSMFADLEYLSSDALRGRFTFSEELGVAADYLAGQYAAMGIEPVGGSYRAPFEAPAGFEPGDALTVWVERPGGQSQQVAGERIVTLATGGGTTAYAEALSVEALAPLTSAARGKIVVTAAPPPERRNEALRTAAALGPAGLVLVGEGPAPDGAASREALGDLSVPIAWLSVETAARWLGSKPGRAGPRVAPGVRVSMAARRVERREDTFNVLAALPGREHPEQIVILGAHYDHIGTAEPGQMCRPKDGDEICNGADDNGSGTAMVLAVARAYADAGYRPARTVVFAHFAGEELGLHGSAALAKAPPSAPPFEGGRVVAMVNLDMVGRLGEDGLAIGGISSSDAWMPLLESLDHGDLPIVYERAINSRSDHASFYRKKIPVLFFFTGLHDDYHQASDHFDRINREGMVAIGQMVAALVQSVADGAEVPYAAPRTNDEGIVSRMPGSKGATVEKRTRPTDAEPPERD